MIQPIKSFLEKVFKCRIYRYTLPQGTDLFMDLNRYFGLNQFKTVFDIGANIGQTALIYSKQFPRANIYSFEPVLTSYKALTSVAESIPKIKVFNYGMGKTRSTCSINVNPVSRTSSILYARPEDYKENIEINTVTDFCREHQIDTIDFMKTDTEGYELEVLEGCRSLLEKQKIKFIIAECEPFEKSEYFVSFQSLCELLNSFDYELFGIYEQQLHWDGKKSIMYMNPLFICHELI